MTDQQAESDRFRLARLGVAQQLSELLPSVVGSGLSAEAALIAQLINAILLNQSYDLLMRLRTTKPDA